MRYLETILFTIKCKWENQVKKVAQTTEEENAELQQLELITILHIIQIITLNVRNV
jgi:hypothetical protein